MGQQKRILVVGTGAIGGYVGGSLGMDGHAVVFLCRPQTAAALADGGLSISMPGGDRVFQPLVTVSADEAMQAGPFDLLLLAVKRYDTAAALKSLKTYSGQLPPILNLQNGIGAEMDVETLLPGVWCIPGTVTTAVGRPSLNHLVVDRFRGMGLAGEQPEVLAWTAVLTQAGLNAVHYPSAAAMKWSKLLTNLIANPLSAILDFRPAEIFADPDLFRIEMLQLREALAVMRAMNIPVVDLPGTPVRLLAFCTRYLPLPIARPLLGQALGSGRGDKMPSFHSDLHRGVGKSEIHYLHGAVVQKARELGLLAPVNQLLVDTLSGMIAGEIPLETFRHRPDLLLRRLH